MRVPRFSPGSIPPRSVPTPCELLPLLAQLPRYCLCALSNTHLCETARLRHPPSTAHTVLTSLACARCFGELLWDAAFGSNFGEQLWGTTCGEQLCGFAAAMTNSCFEEWQLWGSSFSKQLWEAALGSRSSFEDQLSEAALRGSFEQQLWKTAALGSSFGG